MKQMLDYYWRKLREFLLDTQVFQICAYFCFAHRACEKEAVPLFERLPFGKGQLSALLQAVPDYEVKRAAINLENAIDWVFIFEHEDVEKLLKNLQSDFEKYTATPEWLNKNLVQLVELANQVMSLVTTPNSVGELVAVLVASHQSNYIADFCCGGFNLGYQIWHAQGAHSNVTCYGEEINSQLCDIACLRLFLSGVDRVEIKNRDILSEPDEKERQRYELILADFPVGKNRALPFQISDNRFHGYYPKSIYSDWLFIQDAIYRLSSTGKAFLIVTKGALVRRNEIELRRQLIEMDWLEAVITLPANLYSNTGLAMELMVCNKKKPDERKKQILFADLSKFSMRQSRQHCELTQEGIACAQRVYTQFTSEEDISCVASINQILEHEFSLNPLTYIKVSALPETTAPKVALDQIATITRGLQLLRNDQLRVSPPTRYLLNIKDIEHGVIQFAGAERIPCEKTIWDKKFLIQEDDIILTSKGTTLKIAIVLPDPPEAYISGNLTLLRVNRKEYNPYALYEYLCSDEGRLLLERLQTGTTIRVLSNTNLAKLNVPIYNKEMMESVGMQLKKNWTIYRSDLEQMTKEFKQKREELCASLNAGGTTYE